MQSKLARVSFTDCAGLPRSMWAAAVPANYDRSLGALVEDIYGDHQLMVRTLSRPVLNLIWYITHVLAGSIGGAVLSCTRPHTRVVSALISTRVCVRSAAFLLILTEGLVLAPGKA